MNVLLLAVAVFLLLNVAALLWRVVHGPHPADRLVGTQAIATQSIGILLLLSEASGDRATADVAILLALFAVVSTAAFVQRLMPHVHGERPGDD